MAGNRTTIVNAKMTLEHTNTSLEYALRVITLLHRPHSVTELSRTADLAITTTYRLVAALKGLGVVASLGRFPSPRAKHKVESYYISTVALAENPKLKQIQETLRDNPHALEELLDIPVTPWNTWPGVTR